MRRSQLPSLRVQDVGAPATTVNKAIQAWKDNGWDDLSPKTVMGYENTWRIHIEKSIGKERIATLGTYEVESYYRRLKAKGVKRPLGEASKVRGEVAIFKIDLRADLSIVDTIAIWSHPSPRIPRPLDENSLRRHQAPEGRAVFQIARFLFLWDRACLPD